MRDWSWNQTVDILGFGSNLVAHAYRIDFVTGIIYTFVIMMVEQYRDSDQLLQRSLVIQLYQIDIQEHVWEQIHGKERLRGFFQEVDQRLQLKDRFYIRKI